MFKVILAIAVALMLASPTNAKQPNIAFKQGADLLAKGNYSKAITVLDSLRKAGQQSPALYCNLGTAYYKTGQFGRAILFYEKGLRLSPFNEQLIHNRAMVNARLNFGDINNKALDNNSLIYRLAYESILPLLIVLLFGGILFALSSFNVFRQSKLIFSCVGKACLCIIIPVLILSSVVIIYYNNVRYGVAVSRYTVRAAPAVTSKIAFNIQEGQKVLITNYFDGWYKIKAGNAQQGWVRSPGFEEID